MKIYKGIFLIFIIIIFHPTIAVGEHWIQFGKSTDNAIYSYDRDSIFYPYKTKNIIRVTVMIEDWRGNKTIIVTQVDCYKKEIDILQKYFNSKQIEPEKTFYVISGTMGELLYKILCNKKS